MLGALGAATPAPASAAAKLPIHAYVPDSEGGLSVFERQVRVRDEHALIKLAVAAVLELVSHQFRLAPMSLAKPSKTRGVRIGRTARRPRE